MVMVNRIIMMVMVSDGVGGHADAADGGGDDGGDDCDYAYDYDSV